MGLAFPAQGSSLEIHGPAVLNLGGLPWCGRITAGGTRQLLKDIWGFGCYEHSYCEQSHVSFCANPNLHFSGAHGEERSCGAIGDAGTTDFWWGSHSISPVLSREARPFSKEKAASKTNLLFSFSTFHIMAKEATQLTSFVIIK